MSLGTLGTFVIKRLACVGLKASILASAIGAHDIEWQWKTSRAISRPRRVHSITTKTGSSLGARTVAPYVVRTIAKGDGNHVVARPQRLLRPRETSSTDLGSVRLGNPLRRIRVGDHHRCLAGVTGDTH
jgi:hypothetical protein